METTALAELTVLGVLRIHIFFFLRNGTKGECYLQSFAVIQFILKADTRGKDVKNVSRVSCEEVDPRV